MHVLVTGAAGYIGSHACDRLLKAGHTVVGLDDLSRGHREAVSIVAEGAGDRFRFVEGSVCDAGAVGSALSAGGRVDAVMHFAAYALVGESVERPLLYYRNNVGGLVTLLEACGGANGGAGVPRFVFSSSCSTYGQPPEGMIPVREDCPKSPMSPYGRTKWMGEQILEDFAEGERRAGRAFGFACLRYFNVCGCSLGGRLGEDHDPETHIIPVVMQAALGRRSHVGVFGTDYPTRDGTCVRDYIHVEDLADAHIAVMGALQAGDDRRYNLGIGKGYSVREIISAVREVTGKPIRVVEEGRRPGDPPMVYADASRVRSEVGWSPRVTDLRAIVSSAWSWFEKHPGGYGGGKKL
ncbi:MAG: UDP-glucose 4-epimerase GalE [Phycisphaeraceae bacterium]|nr:MAG: UDP-glucose 4-epimerase GalE [Phycisphaeraceae bacterium]